MPSLVTLLITLRELLQTVPGQGQPAFQFNAQVLNILDVIAAKLEKLEQETSV